MKLNESQGTIAGRKIQLDTASGKQSSRKNQRRSNNGGGDGMIDGSKFRGGKFGNRGGRQDNNKDDGPPLQRPSLKLAPRTKKAEDGDASGPSNIFGGARARDAQAWEERRKSDNSSDRRQSQSSNSNSGRGGRGSRGGRGGHNNNSSSKGENGKDRRKTKEQKKQISPEERAAMAKAAAEAAAPAPAPKPAAPVNKFALLMDDSDSD